MPWTILKKNSLAIIIGAIIIKGVFLLLFIPPWEIPDEPAHFQYAQSLAEGQGLPIFAGSKIAMSPALYQSSQHTEFDRLRETDITVGTGPVDSNQVKGVTMVNAAVVQGPIYYLLEAIPYRLLSGFTITTQLYGMRLLSVILFALVVFLTYKIAWLIKSNRIFALTAAVLVGFQPMASFVFAGVNNDIMVTLIASSAFYLMAKMIFNGISWKSSIALGIIVGCGVFSKESLAPFIPLGGGLALLLTGGRIWRQRILQSMIVMAIASIIGLAWPLRTALTQIPQPAVNYPEFKSQIIHNSWANNTSLLLTYRLPIIFRSFWGTLSQYFYSSTVTFPKLLFYFLAGASLFGMGGAIRFLINSRNTSIEYQLRRTVIVFLAAWVLLETLLSGTFLYNLYRHGNSFFPLQGRYYFPLLPVMIILVLIGWEKIIPRNYHRGIYATMMFLAIILGIYSVYPVMWLGYR